MSAQALQAQAMELMLAGQQEDILTLLDSYNPGWRDAGRTFAEMLGMGIADGQQDIERQLQDTLLMLNDFQPQLNALQVKGNPVLGNQPQNPALHHHSTSATPLDTEMRNLLTTINSTIESTTTAIGTIARDTFAAFKNPLENEFQGVNHMLGSVVVAINGLRSLLGEPRVVITNNFNGVTAPDVPHLADRANTALLRALGAG